MRFIILSLILFLIVNCEKKEKNKCWEWLGQCRTLFDRLQDNEAKTRDKVNSCTLENSININGDMNPIFQCINERVINKIIFKNNDELLNSEKVIASETVKCLCPNKATPYSIKWSKGKELNLETFPPNVPVILITIKTTLDTNAYPIGTNLFCITTCEESNQKYINQYQVLKIRSSP